LFPLQSSPLTNTQHETPEERVWGAAYHIPSSHVAEVRSYLDIREINGYSIQFTPFYPASPSCPKSTSPPQPMKTLVYIGLPSNPQFLGPQDPQKLAEHILNSRGPSGENKEYLYMLEEGLRGLSTESDDLHVGDLVRRARGIEETGGVKSGGEAGAALHKVGSTEEQEEVEK
jgi:cation transport protein ChaC